MDWISRPELDRGSTGSLLITIQRGWQHRLQYSENSQKGSGYTEGLQLPAFRLDEHDTEIQAEIKILDNMNGSVME